MPVPKGALCGAVARVRLLSSHVTHQSHVAANAPGMLRAHHIAYRSAELGTTLAAHPDYNEVRLQKRVSI